MRKRDVRLGMEVVHHRTGKPVGKVVTVGGHIIRTDSVENPLAHWSELSPAPSPEDHRAE